MLTAVFGQQKNKLLLSILQLIACTESHVVVFIIVDIRNTCTILRSYNFNTTLDAYCMHIHDINQLIFLCSFPISAMEKQYFLFTFDVNFYVIILVQNGVF